MSVEAWASLIVMALFNVLSTAFYIGVNKQMLTEVMRRMENVERFKADNGTLDLHVKRLDGEQERFDREMGHIRDLIQRSARGQS